ncbi:Tfp pilus assembly protein PilP [Microbacterium testaceum StLB037]|uniref:Tfp pilus assembly protein PilP n=1 Tax=Microbacterium testaceum (strain StLB037) TaxID=979556 RepID=E8NAS6_MICTS|nr:hypothetical protein [Microbacterium testaceum]BAJ75943.1 Tfp pilus assembly protein PilP [Microbacterium testaceum StLB037]
MSSPFAAPYVAPATGTLLAPPPSSKKRRPLGAFALVAGILSMVVAPAVAGFAAFRVARGAGAQIVAQGGQNIDLRVLSPVRDLVLVVEVAFWTGTVLGIAALVVGIIATARDSGRPMGIVAIVLAALGPVIFAAFVALALAAGAGTLADSGGSLT